MCLKLDNLQFNVVAEISDHPSHTWVPVSCKQNIPSSNPIAVCLSEIREGLCAGTDPLLHL